MLTLQRPSYMLYLIYYENEESHFVYQTGDSIVLRGVSYGWHNLWPRFYNKQSVKWLKKDWKCTVLRAAMGTVIEDNYIENPEFALKCMNIFMKSSRISRR